MKTIKSSKEITTLELGDLVIFGDLKYRVHCRIGYFLSSSGCDNDQIFTILGISKRDFIKNLGINILPTEEIFPEVKSLEALTAVVSALFKKYEKQNELPKTLEEFCERNPLKIGECLLGSFCNIYITKTKGTHRDADRDRNYFVSKQEAEAFLALMQLRQLRKAYVKDWEPNYKNIYFGIYSTNESLSIMGYADINRSLSFPTYELAEQFLTNFKDLLEIAKPLL